MKKVLVLTVSVLLLTSLFTACGNSGRKTLHCDNCGKQLDPTDLINPRSKINGETPEFVDTLETQYLKKVVIKYV